MPQEACLINDDCLSVDPHRFCVAPMMDWTDRHDRRFLRELSKRALLYTEMVTSAALEFGDRDSRSAVRRFRPKTITASREIG